MTIPPTPPEFPFRRTGRVVHSARGLYGLAGAIAAFVLGMGALAVASPALSGGAVVTLCCFLAVLLAMAGWSARCGRRVAHWEREYERVMGRKFAP